MKRERAAALAREAGIRDSLWYALTMAGSAYREYTATGSACGSGSMITGAGAGASVPFVHSTLIFPPSPTWE